MIEQYVFNKIVGDATLQGLLTDGAGGFNVYPNVVPRGLLFTKAITFTTILTTDVFPNANSVNVQFNIFAKTHSDLGTISGALSNLFNGDNNQLSGGIDMIYSQRRSESDLGFNFDESIYQREATYYFKIRK